MQESFADLSGARRSPLPQPPTWMRSLLTTVRTARAWSYNEQLREILERKQISVVRTMLVHCVLE